MLLHLFVAGADIDGCVGHETDCALDTNSNGTCLDVPAPGIGHTCACLAGKSWEYGKCRGAQVIVHNLFTSRYWDTKQRLFLLAKAELQIVSPRIHC